MDGTLLKRAGFKESYRYICLMFILGFVWGLYKLPPIGLLIRLGLSYMPTLEKGLLHTI